MHVNRGNSFYLMYNVIKNFEGGEKIRNLIKTIEF